MQARSAAAMVKGYQEFDPDLNVAGVIFNKIGGAAHKEWLVEAVAATGVQTTVFGGMPKVSMLHSNAVKQLWLALHASQGSHTSAVQLCLFLSR